RRGAAHPIGHDQQRAALPHLLLAWGAVAGALPAGQIRDEVTILVVLARLAEVGAAQDLDSNGFGGASEHVSVAALGLMQRGVRLRVGIQRHRPSDPVAAALTIPLLLPKGVRDNERRRRLVDRRSEERRVGKEWWSRAGP